MSYSEQLANLLTKLRPTSPDADKELVRSQIAEIDAKLEIQANAYREQAEALEAQRQALDDGFAQITAPLNAERDELQAGLTELEGVEA